MKGGAEEERKKSLPDWLSGEMRGSASPGCQRARSPGSLFACFCFPSSSPSRILHSRSQAARRRSRASGLFMACLRLFPSPFCIIVSSDYRISFRVPRDTPSTSSLPARARTIVCPRVARAGKFMPLRLRRERWASAGAGLWGV